jgi:hypothetical protein
MGKETQSLGPFEIPLSRLFPNCVNDVKKIYESTKGLPDFSSSDIAKAWILAGPTSGGFYRRLNSLLNYGLIEPATPRGRFRVSQLAKDILYPDDDNHRSEAYKRAFFNVPLWKQLYGKFEKNPPESIYSHLKSITGAEPDDIQRLQREIRKWYLEDISLISKEIIEENSYIRPPTNDTKEPEKSMVSSNISDAREGLEKIPFGDNIIIYLPKNNIHKWWDKAKRHMDLFLEDYEPSSPDN